MSTNKCIDAGDFLKNLDSPKSSLSWLADIQSEALATLKKEGFPTKKVELWKYTGVEPIVESDFSIAKEAAEVTFNPIPETYSLVFVDGVYSETLSNIAGTPEGLVIKSLAQAFEENTSAVQQALSEAPNDCSDAFTHLNRAFLKQGIFIEVAKNVAVEKPLHIVNIGSRENTVSMTRNIIVVNTGAELEIFEDFISQGDAKTFSNPVTDIHLCKNAVLRHTKNQSQNTNSFHIASIRVSQERDSSYFSSVLTSGSAISRLNLDTELNDENASCDFKGLYAIKGSQLADNHTVMNHNAARTFSDQLYKGILDDRSRGVFNGKVFIAKDAQQVESAQLNKNLMLSKSARIDTKPELDVYADDVKAAHGAAIGQLNEEELFYIQSRCISKDDAMAMLVHGHMEEIIATVKSESIRTYLEKIYLDLFS
ncbi:MAG: Fe-S cluster assembly protein SufD [Lentisphaeraceae bacterium]|nr:Fe-S cluster assembly protein SufD [Lentisphaeraceae bacterium]